MGLPSSEKTGAWVPAVVVEAHRQQSLGQGDRRGAQRSFRRTLTMEPRCCWGATRPPSWPSRHRTWRTLVWLWTAGRKRQLQGLRGQRCQGRVGAAWTSTACCGAKSVCRKRWISSPRCSPPWGGARRCSCTAMVGGTGPSLSMEHVCVGVLRM